MFHSNPAANGGQRQVFERSAKALGIEEFEAVPYLQLAIVVCYGKIPPVGQRPGNFNLIVDFKKDSAVGSQVQRTGKSQFTNRIAGRKSATGFDDG